jgi:geranylgeranyl reductase family protein
VESREFDLIVIGAGPAGSFAAEKIAAAGRRVALFDGRPEGEPKACGGGVTSKALNEWPHLKDAVGRLIDRIEMYSPGGKRLDLKLEQPFAIYSRVAFDTYLRNRAASSGATVYAQKVSFARTMRTENGWAVSADNGLQISAPILVAADGANSRFAKEWAGAVPVSEMEVAFGYRAPLPSDSEPSTVVAFLPKWAGYAWAFPRPDHISFGIATSQDAFDHKAMDELLWDFMVFFYGGAKVKRNGLWGSMGGPKAKASNEYRTVLAELKGTAERYAARIPGLAPSTWDNRKAVGTDWALLGDAAGFADPVTGEGIYYALRSGEIFADAYLTGDMQSYQARWREDFGRELKRASQMRTRFYGTYLGAPFTERMISFARRHPGIRKVLGELVAGEQGYVGLKSKLAKSAIGLKGVKGKR